MTQVGFFSDSERGQVVPQKHHNADSETRSKSPFETVISPVSAGFGLYCVIWMVMIVRPVDTSLQVEPEEHTRVSMDRATSLSRTMPNQTEREMSKLCSARQDMTAQSSPPAASWSGLWQGALKETVSGGGLRLNWGCHIQSLSLIHI